MTHTRKKLDEKSAHKGSPYSKQGPVCFVALQPRKGKRIGGGKKVQQKKEEKGGILESDSGGRGKEGFLFECVEKKRRERGVSEGGGT